MHPTVHTRDLYYPRIRLGDRFDVEELQQGKILGVCRRQIIICTGLTFGPTDISIEVLGEGTVSDDTALDQWETVEEASVWLDAPVPLKQVHGDLIEDIPELDQVTDGLYRVRVYVRGRDLRQTHVACHIEILPTASPIELSLLADGDKVHTRDLATTVIRRRPDPPCTRDQAATTPESLDRAWRQLLDALANREAHATLAAIASPVPEHELDRIRADSRLSWPPQLTEFYALHDGLREWTQLLPQHDLLGVAAADQLRRETSAIWGEFDDPTTYEGAQAGESTGTFLPQYFPIAERDGYILFCDTRPGPQHGCITEHRREDADILASYWESLAHLVTDLADSITNGTPFMSDWTPSVEAGRLVWSDQA